MQRKNKYGASGSSAHFSDTDIVNVMAPVLKKVGDCPRSKRFVAGSESLKKKWKKKNSKKKGRSEIDKGNSVAEIVAQCDINDEGLRNSENFGGRVESSYKNKDKQNDNGIANGKLYLCYIHLLKLML